MPLHFKSYLQKKSAYKGGRSKTEAMQTDKPIYKLSSNENPLGASPKAIQAIINSAPALFEYPDRTDKRLCEALEVFYENKLAASQFFCTNSGLENIQIITQAFLEAGDECIFSNPAFGAYKSFVGKAGAKGIDIPLIGDNFGMDVPAILAAITDKTRLIFITSPNNPTGTYLPKSEVDALINGIPDHVVVVIDEVYFQYVDVADYVRALPYVLAGKNVIGINSFSKAYGLAGLRLGYSYSTPEISDYLRQLRRPFLMNTLSINAGIAALADTDFIERTVALVQEEKPFLYHHLDRLGIKYWKTQANFILIKPDMDPKVFEEGLLAEGIMVRNATSFGAKDCIRVTIGTRTANEVYVNALEKVLGTQG